MDKKQREEFDAMLNRPPAGASKAQVASTKEWAEGAAGDNFLAQMAARGGGGRLTRDGIKNQ